MIIVEGPDGGGKSTLARYLSAQLDIGLSADSLLSDAERNDPSFRARDNVRQRVWASLLRECTARHAPVIHDRLFWSELVYSETFGRECAFPYDEQRMISRLMLALEVPIIFCLPPWETVAKGFVEADHMSGMPAHIETVYAKYKLMMKFMQGSRRDQSVRVNVRVATLGASRVGKELSLPRVIHYNYENPRHQEKVLGICRRYLQRREKRSVAWD